MWLKLNLPSFPYQYVFLAELLLPLTEPLFDRPPSFNASETFKFFLLVFLLHVARNHIYLLILPKECLTNSSLFSFPVVKSYPRGPYNLLFCVYNNFLPDSPRIDTLYTPIQPGYYQQITPLKLCFDHVRSLLNNFQCLSTPSGIKFKPSNLVFRNLSQVGYNLPRQVYLLLFWLTYYNSCSCPTTHSRTTLPAFVHIVFFSSLLVNILAILQSSNATFFLQLVWSS